MLSCDEHEQIQKYKTHVDKRLKTACVQTILLKHLTMQFKKKVHIKLKYRINVHINYPNITN